MEKLLYILFGWLLGIGSSLLLRWNDKISKTNEFKRGLKSELIATLPRMIKTVVSLKLSLGTLDHESILWSLEVNQENLQKNMEVAIKLISENLYLNVEDCMVLLSRL